MCLKVFVNQIAYVYYIAQLEFNMLSTTTQSCWCESLVVICWVIFLYYFNPVSIQFSQMSCRNVFIYLKIVTDVWHQAIIHDPVQHSEVLINSIHITVSCLYKSSHRPLSIVLCWWLGESQWGLSCLLTNAIMGQSASPQQRQPWPDHHATM